MTKPTFRSRLSGSWWTIWVMELEEQVSRHSLSPLERVVAHFSSVCRSLAFACALALAVVTFMSLMGDNPEEGVGRWLEGGIILVLVVLMFAALVAAMLLPLFACLEAWWKQILCVVPVIALMALFAYWTSGGGESDEQGWVEWFEPLFFAIPILLLLGQLTGAPLGRRLDERSQRQDAANDEKLRAHVDAGLEEFRAQPVQGRPGLGSAGREKFGDAAVHGSLGERQTAAAIDDWAITDPEVTVFHGLEFPGSISADVDHAVVVGQRVALLDSKRWRAGHYAFDQHGYLTRDGLAFTGGDVHMADAVRGYAASLDEHDAQVTGWIVLTPGNGKARVTVDNSRAPTELRLVTLWSPTGDALPWVNTWLHEADARPQSVLQGMYGLLILQKLRSSLLGR